MENILNILPNNFILLMLTILFAGFVRGFLGFGSGLIIMPILSFLYSPIFAIVFSIIIEIPSTIYLTFEGARKCKFKEIMPMFFSMMIAFPIGIFFLISINAEIVKIIMSIFVIFFVILIATGWRLKTTITKYILVISGALGGLMGGIAGIAGPPIVTVLLSKGDSNDVTRGNILIMFTGVVLIAIISLYYFNLFSKSLLLLGVITSPFYIIAVITGSRYYSFSGNKYYRNISLLILGIIGFSTLIGAIY
tara:strand:- start:824 stop:1573 length:750 start_codon:yes stop_codon:yes gene_type:complete